MRSSRRARAARSLVVGGDQGQMVPKAHMVADVQITANRSPRPAAPLAAPPWPISTSKTEIGPRTLTGRNRPYPLAPVSTKSTRFAPDSPLEGDGFELPVRGRGQSGCRPFWVGLCFAIGCGPGEALLVQRGISDGAGRSEPPASGRPTARRTFGALDWARPEVMTVCSARLSNDIRCTSPPCSSLAIRCSLGT